MARTPGVEYAVGREPRSQYNESGAGSQGTLVQFGIEYMDPYDAEGRLLPLLTPSQKRKARPRRPRRTKAAPRRSRRARSQHLLQRSLA